MPKPTGATEKPYDRILMRMREKWPVKYPANKSITQRQVAGIVGVSQPSVAKWANGGPIDRTNLVKLAVKLDVMTEWLESGRGPRFPGPLDDPLLADIWRRITMMDEPQRMELTRYAAYITDEAAKKVG